MGPYSSAFLVVAFEYLVVQGCTFPVFRDMLEKETPRGADGGAAAHADVTSVDDASQKVNHLGFFSGHFGGREYHVSSTDSWLNAHRSVGRISDPSWSGTNTGWHRKPSPWPHARCLAISHL